MRLGTGALKVGGELERLSHSKEVSIATLLTGSTLRADTNWHCHTEGIQWKLLI